MTRHDGDDRAAVFVIATARGHYDEPGHPLLFNLLNEMDGLAATDDVLFVLTTNRPDVLEPALAARPGRIDHAVEIGLPGERERRLLLDLYLAGSGRDLTILDSVVERTAGVTASFMKELVRRAVLVVLERSGTWHTAGDGSGELDGSTGLSGSPGSLVVDEAAVVTDDDLEAALVELLHSASSVTQSLFGLASDA